MEIAEGSICIAIEFFIIRAASAVDGSSTCHVGRVQGHESSSKLSSASNVMSEPINRLMLHYRLSDYRY